MRVFEAAIDARAVHNLSDGPTSPFIPVGRNSCCGPRLPSLQNAALNQIIDIAERGIWRAFLDDRPFGRGQLALESVQQPIDHVALTVVELVGGMPLPKLGLGKNIGEGFLRAFDGAVEARRNHSSQAVMLRSGAFWVSSRML